MPRDLGKELRKVLVMEQGGKVVSGTPQKGGQVTISMRPKQTYRGDRKAALAALKKSYPGCAFKWKE